MEQMNNGGSSTPTGRKFRPKRRLSQVPRPMEGTVQSRIEMREKQMRALELRKSGATYDQIAKVLGYADASSASTMVRKAFDQMLQEPAHDLRKLQIERLNHILLVQWPAVQAGDRGAAETAMRVMERLDRLMGTEAPQQAEVNVNLQGAVLVVDGNEDEYVQHMKRMAGIVEAQKELEQPVLDAEIIEEDEDDANGTSQG